MPRSEIAAGSCGGFISYFERNLHTIFYSGSINLHSQQQWKTVPFSPHFPAFIVHRHFEEGHSDQLSPVRWYLIVVLICISVIVSDIEHLFMCLLAICMSLWRNVCLPLLPTFWLGCLFFWYGVVWAACIFWKLILRQFFHLLLCSPILRNVLSLCL